MVSGMLCPRMLHRACGDLQGVRRRVVVFLGERPFRTTDGIDALPVASFLDELAEGRL